MNCSLGERDTTALLYVDSRSGSGQHSLNPRTDRPAEAVTVLQGDKLVRSGQLPIPNVMKIDVEGAEVSVIAGLKNSLANKKCRLVFCEIHNVMLERNGEDPKAVDRMLREAGFTNFETSSRGPENHLIARKMGSK